MGSAGYICTPVYKEISYLGSKVRPAPIAGSPSDALIEAGVLTVTEIASEDENALYVEYSRRLGMGEAMTIAIAQSRGWAIATDDRKARNVATATMVSSPCTILTTAEIVRNWVEITTPRLAEAGRAICRIERIGRFRPSAGHALRGWWDATKAQAP